MKANFLRPVHGPRPIPSKDFECLIEVARKQIFANIDPMSLLHGEGMAHESAETRPIGREELTKRIFGILSLFLEKSLAESYISEERRIEYTQALAASDIGPLTGLWGGMQATILPRKERTKILNSFKEELLAKPERFGHIFKTSMGSHYFTLSTGESFRIQSKKPVDAFDAEEGENLFIAPLAKNIVFLDPEDPTLKEYMYEKRSKNLNQTFFLDKPLLAAPEPFEGAYTLECNFDEPRSDSFTVRMLEGGLMQVNLEKQSEHPERAAYSVKGLHFGNQITEVIK